MCLAGQQAVCLPPRTTRSGRTLGACAPASGRHTRCLRPNRDYPYTTVPNQVHRIFRAQQLHDRKHYDERMSATPEARAKMEYVDYLRPIIADADTGYVMTAIDYVVS
jgi:isocitrate lyase